MNCQRFEEVVNDIAREQIIEAGAREAALSHSDGCGVCAVRLEDERAMTLRLRELAEAMESASAPARVEARLLAAFDQIAPSQLPAPRVSAARQYQRRYLFGAIAAGLLIVFGLLAMRALQPVPVARAPEIPPIASAGTRAPTDPQFLPPTGRQRVSGYAGSRNRSSKPKSGVSTKPGPVKNGSTEIATDFLPLTYGAATNLEEGGRMVRVDLPHSALATFGLPVNMDRANERVKADVLFGVDGLAQAIRFVR